MHHPVRAAALVALSLIGTLLAVGPVAPGSAGGPLRAHDSTGFVPVPVGFEDLGFRVSDTGRAGAEPSLGVDAQGRIFFQAMLRILRSDDEAQTWRDVTPATAAPESFDPMLWVDRATGRVVTNQLTMACSWSAWSDDAGGSWTGVNPVYCSTPPSPTYDHQKIHTGRVPPLMSHAALGVAPRTYPSATFFAWNDGSQSHVSMSLDGGVTFPFSTTSATGTCSGGLHGRLRSMPDGTLVLPKRDCNGPVVSVSKSFYYWRQVKVGASVGTTEHTKNPEIAIDAAGVAYLTWVGADERLYVSVSRDVWNGSWSAPIRASPPDVLSTTMPSIVAGAEGKVALLYYGTDDGAAPPDHALDTTRWHAYVTYALDALAPDPTFVTAQLTTDADPIQVGAISTNSHHAPAGSRNLLDFTDLWLTPDGRVVAAYADGCTSYLACNAVANATPSLSRDNNGVAAVQLAGPRLT